MSIRLCDLIIAQEKSKIKAGEGKTKGDYKFFTSSNIQTKYVDFFQYDKPALIFGTGGMPSIHYCDEPFSTSTDCIVFYAKNNRYSLKSLYLFFESHMNLLEEGFHGAGLQHISKKYLLDIQIPDIPIEQQLKINNIGDKLNRLIDIRKNQLENYNSIVKSRFIEMFGSYPINPKGWNIGKIRDIVKDVRYGSSRPAVVGGKYPYLRMNNITYDGKLDLTDIKYIDVPESELDKCAVRKGDVLFNRTNSRELVGKTCVYTNNEIMVLAGFIIRIRVNELVLPEFLSSFLNTDFSKQKLFNMCKTAIGQANINAQELQNIGIYLPPIKLQQEFVQFKKQVDKSKLAIEKSIEKLEILKKSLMQEYFG